MPITRIDITFASVSQLAGIIEGEWDACDRPEALTEILHFLVRVPEPDGLQQIQCHTLLLNGLLAHLEGWNGSSADVIIKEIKSRIYDWTQQLNHPPPEHVQFVFTGTDKPSSV